MPSLGGRPKCLQSSLKFTFASNQSWRREEIFVREAEIRQLSKSCSDPLQKEISRSTIWLFSNFFIILAIAASTKFVWGERPPDECHCDSQLNFILCWKLNWESDGCLPGSNELAFCDAGIQTPDLWCRRQPSDQHVSQLLPQPGPPSIIHKFELIKLCKAKAHFNSILLSNYANNKPMFSVKKFWGCTKSNPGLQFHLLTLRTTRLSPKSLRWQELLNRCWSLSVNLWQEIPTFCPFFVWPVLKNEFKLIQESVFKKIWHEFLVSTKSYCLRCFQ